VKLKLDRRQNVRFSVTFGAQVLPIEPPAFVDPIPTRAVTALQAQVSALSALHRSRVIAAYTASVFQIPNTFAVFT